MEQKSITWDDIIKEYFKRHPDAGIAWWMLPIEEQPEGIKIELYDIVWSLLKEDK